MPAPGAGHDFGDRRPRGLPDPPERRRHLGRAPGTDAPGRGGRDRRRARAERVGEDDVAAHRCGFRHAFGRDRARARHGGRRARPGRGGQVPRREPGPARPALRARPLPRPRLRAQRRARPRAARDAARRGAEGGGNAARAGRPRRPARTRGRARSPAASSSASPCARHSPTVLGSCSRTSRPASSTRRTHAPSTG